MLFEFESGDEGFSELEISIDLSEVSIRNKIAYKAPS